MDDQQQSSSPGPAADPPTFPDYDTADSRAHAAVRYGIYRIVEREHGAAAFHEEPIFPGASSTERRPEPLAELKAAAKLRQEVQIAVRGAVTRARRVGVTWRQLAQPLGVSADSDDPALEAWQATVGPDDDLWNSRSFTFRCTCGGLVVDRGPYESHPRDNEDGHQDGCAIMDGLLADWRARNEQEEEG
jgi:hypothetical protein